MRLAQKKRQDYINRESQPRSEDLPQYKTFSLGLDFMETNKDADKWFLQIETFDPHEPFFSHDEYRKLYPHDWDGPEFDWPSYREVREDQATVEHIRYTYAALLTFCDAQLGRVLDMFVSSFDLTFWPFFLVLNVAPLPTGPTQHVGGHDADREHRPRIFDGRA